MKDKVKIWPPFIFIFIVAMSAGCSSLKDTVIKNDEKREQRDKAESELTKEVVLSEKEIELEDGLSAVKYDGDYGFDEFIRQGGASSDAEVAAFLAQYLMIGKEELTFLGEVFGCSTISVKNSDEETLFGRNFDWENCDALVAGTEPEDGYASISTVNMGFIRQGAGAGGIALLSPEVRKIAALYAPLDGMNEKGLCVAVNMIQDASTIEQNTEKPDITTTTAVRLLLNKAADVEEAIALLEQYDMHGSMGMMVHFALADSSGRSVVVEYIENEMIVMDTPVVTNFYLSPGEKNGIGTDQSHTRYEILTEQLNQTPLMNMEDVKNALDSVSKDNFGEFESTEWSIVFNQSSKEVRYYHRENYKDSYTFYIK